jgi:16S rRNA (guanine527-N7)-methyltransferase
VTEIEARLRRVLERARTLGFLGPGPVDPHIVHARGFAAASGLTAPDSIVDLGSGGGVPGLVLSIMWPAATMLLVEANQRRSRHLVEAVAELELGDRVSVVTERGEGVAHDPQFRESFELAVARGFAEPAVTAEIAAGLVRVGGQLVVSEPPDARPERWPAPALAELGFGEPAFAARDQGHYVAVPKTGPTGPQIPRGIGRPAKRPLW